MHKWLYTLVVKVLAEVKYTWIATMSRNRICMQPIRELNIPPKSVHLFAFGKGV
jgi:hypothetical protein